MFQVSPDQTGADRKGAENCSGNEHRLSVHLFGEKKGFTYRSAKEQVEYTGVDVESIELVHLCVDQYSGDNGRANQAAQRNDNARPRPQEEQQQYRQQTYGGERGEMCEEHGTAKDQRYRLR